MRASLNSRRHLRHYNRTQYAYTVVPKPDYGKKSFNLFLHRRTKLMKVMTVSAVVAAHARCSKTTKTSSLALVCVKEVCFMTESWSQLQQKGMSIQTDAAN